MNFVARSIGVATFNHDGWEILAVDSSYLLHVPKTNQILSVDAFRSNLGIIVVDQQCKLRPRLRVPALVPHNENLNSPKQATHAPAT